MSYVDELRAKVLHHPPTNECPVLECLVCGIRDCPHHDVLHYHHNGCPSCCRAEQTTLTFNRLRQANLKRCQELFGGFDRWTPGEWACAMAGECGEACNEIKKLTRLTTNPSWNKDGRDSAEIIAAAGKELADLIIYADLLATKLGINLGDEVAKKFNEVSKKMGGNRWKEFTLSNPQD